jgi:hypothetical protein
MSNPKKTKNKTNEMLPMYHDLSTMSIAIDNGKRMKMMRIVANRAFGGK